MSKNKNSIPTSKTPKTSANQATPLQRIAIQHTAIQQTTIFDPEVVHKYSLMVPDAPERILKQFELNGVAERTLKQNLIDSHNTTNQLQAKDNRRRDWMTFSLCLIIIVGGLVLIALNKDLYGMLSVVAGISAIGGTVWYSSQKNKSH